MESSTKLFIATTQHQLTSLLPMGEDMFSDKKEGLTEIQSHVPLLPFHWLATQLHPHPVL